MFKIVPYKASNLNKLSLLYSCRNASAATPATHHGGGHAVKGYDQEEAYPQIGKREIVGFGYNGRPQYFDHCDMPCPSVRWKADTPEILALKNKEKGDWKNLSIADKKELYRASFRQTLVEAVAPTGEWKYVLGWVLGLLGFSLISYHFIMKKFIYKHSDRIDLDYQVKNLERMIAQGQGRIEGISSNWDYEKGDWKWNTGKK